MLLRTIRRSKNHEIATNIYCKSKSNVVPGNASLNDYFNNRNKVPSTAINLLLTNVYFAAWHLISLKFTESLNCQPKRYGLPTGDHYLSDDGVPEMTLSLGYTVQAKLKEEILSLDSYVSLMMDESTDASNESKLLLLLRYCDDFAPKMRYYAICKMPSATAENIFNECWRFLCDDELIFGKDYICFWR